MTGQPQPSPGDNKTRVQSQAARTVKPKHSSTPPGAPLPPGPRPGPRKRSPAPLIACMVLLGAIGAGAGVFLNKAGKVSGGKGALSLIESIRNPRGEFPSKNRVNILLIGYDYSYDWSAKGARYTKDSRSDSIVMLSLDLDTRKISTLSIPRDTWVTAPDGQTGKINATYHRGSAKDGAQGGAKLLAGTVEKLLGVKPDYYIAVAPDAVKTIVDSLGGVQVEALDRMVYNDDAAGLHINLPKGQQVINGEQAVGYARYRHADKLEIGPDGKHIWTGRKDSNGYPLYQKRKHVEKSLEDTDQRRMERQRQLMQAMVSKGKSFGNLLQVDALINTGLEALKTDLDRTQIFALAALFRSTPPDQIQSATLITHNRMRPSVNGRTYTEEVDESKKGDLVAWLLKGDEGAANRLTVVSVQNGTGVSGAAGRVADLLKEKGFTARAGNADGDSRDATLTRIVYEKAMFAPRAERIKQILGGGTLVKEPKPDAALVGRADADLPDVTIVLGRDLAGQFGRRSASL